MKSVARPTYRVMDVDLVIRAQRGDLASYTLIAGEIGDRFLATARRILRDVGLAEDATQQALLAVWQDLPGLRDPARFEAWSYRLLVRACHAEGWRERRAIANLRLIPMAAPVVQDETGLVADRELLERAFERLSLEHRTVVVLHYYADLPLDRIAEICGIPHGTAQSRLFYAMRALRAWVESDQRVPSREVV